MGHLGLIAVGALALLLGAGVAYQWTGSWRDDRRFPPPGRRVRGLHVFESGCPGAPTVILESGVAATSLSWSLVQSRIASFAHVVSYDRWGLGWSDASTSPPVPSRIVEDLRAALGVAKMAPPYVLVGHSFGGLVVRHFATAHPSEVVGLVLLDPLSPSDWWPLTAASRRMLKRGVKLSRRGKWLARIGFVRLCLSLLLAGQQAFPKLAAKLTSGRGSQVTTRLAGEIRKLPRDVWPIVASHWSLAKPFESMARHLECLPASCAELSDKPLPPGIPAIVLTPHNSSAPLDGAERLVAQHSGHWIQLDEPELVVEAIRTMVAKASRIA